jgi:hypothetical protein
MPNPFAKTRQLHEPYAIFINNQGWQWRVLKTYKQPSSEAKDKFARWYVAAISPMTDMRWEYGDTYATEIKNFGQLVSADSEWLKAYSMTELEWAIMPISVH